MFNAYSPLYLEEEVTRHNYRIEMKMPVLVLIFSAFLQCRWSKIIVAATLATPKGFEPKLFFCVHHMVACKFPVTERKMYY